MNMKKYSLIICALMISTLVMAQPHKDAMPGQASGGLDIMSLAIGAVVGIVIGYLVGSRSAKK